LKIHARQLVGFECFRLEALRPQFQRVALVVAVAGLVSLPAVSPANEAGVVAVDVKCRERVCEFAVTLQHGDQGWSHYADAFEVLSVDRVLQAKRVLRHPHVEEQPFTPRRGAASRYPLGHRAWPRQGPRVRGRGATRRDTRRAQGRRGQGRRKGEGQRAPGRVTALAG